MLTYKETRERVNDILMDFFDYEYKMAQVGEFDSDFMEFKTDDLLQLIRENGGIYKEECEGR